MRCGGKYPHLKSPGLDSGNLGSALAGPHLLVGPSAGPSLQLGFLIWKWWAGLRGPKLSSSEPQVHEVLLIGFL